MSDRRHSPEHEQNPSGGLGAAERSVIRAAAIDLMLHLARTLPAQVRRPRRRSEPRPGPT
ncbi:hypothetical protein PQJ75_29255 [Rhodoplanes sp. TEM]|uniref:Uncharacterized protein n=1 Tax=Rhodoplanes tepidamans TaxID=200616 RepID=A0ABT5JAX9_RHOTP|nr:MULTISPECIES: hypothetical protein [Rhodoplanes]MDC7786794.1 hypothetical protein [Rhodoplanes tepidamans]MDC7987842.1 hypothetical protein [Rhodoplanes sp. TEM]MDQ0355921.1 hypothetical protein [Rhodoplanes tepidamans]